MPKQSSLRPRKHAGRAKVGRAAWCVTVPKEVRGPGEQKNRFFKTEREGKAYADKLETKLLNYGRVGSLTGTQELEARGIYEILPPGVNARDMVDAGIEAYEARNKSATFLALFDEYLAVTEKKERLGIYIDQLRSTRNRLKELHDRFVCDIMPEEIESVLSRLNNGNPLTGGARNGIMTTLTAVFNFGIKKKRYLTLNPIHSLEYAVRPRLNPPVIPNYQVEKMLNYALENELEFLPVLIIGFFCGVRPYGEMLKIEWSDLWDSEKDYAWDGELTIRPEVSKTGRARFPKLSANAQAWLKAYIDRGGVTTGKLFPYSVHVRNGRLRTVSRAAGISEWPRQAMRHTFCSCYLGSGGEINELVKMSGHRSVDVMWTHYYRGIPKEEAAAFWSIMPPPAIPPQHIIPFPECSSAERWLPVAGFGGYEVSNHGRVCLLEKVSGTVKLLDSQLKEIRSALKSGCKQQVLADRYGVDQTVISDINTGRRKERFEEYEDGRRILKTRLENRPGNQPRNLTVMLCKNGKKTYRSVHQLVALAFLGPPQSSLCSLVWHKDKCRYNNRAENLEWVRMSDVIQHGIREGRKRRDRGVRGGVRVQKPAKPATYSLPDETLHTVSPVVDNNLSAVG